jgi:peptide/nickel transport system permease protein
VGTQRYLLGKVGQALLTLLFILTFNFFLFRILPGDPVRLLTKGTGQRLSVAEQNQLREDLGLNQPLFPGQYLTYMGQMLRLDLGESTIVAPGQPVTEVFFEKLPKTLFLVGTATAASILIGVVLGIYGGWRRGSTMDLTSMTSSLVLYSIPEFVLGIMLLLLFSGALGLFPSGGYESVVGDLTGPARLADILRHAFLPWLTLTLAYIGEFFLVMRSSLLDVLGEEYIQLARAKGLREKWVLRRHAVRNALLPTITLIALSFGFVLGGAITVELVFSYPGVGLMSFEALEARDFPLLQGTFLFFSIGVLIANLTADLLYAYVDPRVRTG